MRQLPADGRHPYDGCWLDVVTLQFQYHADANIPVECGEPVPGLFFFEYTVADEGHLEFIGTSYLFNN